MSTSTSAPVIKKLDPWQIGINKRFNEWRDKTNPDIRLVKAVQAVQKILDADIPPKDTRLLEVRLAQAVIDSLQILHNDLT